MQINEGIVICDNETKMNILKNRNNIINYKFYTINTLKNKLLGYPLDEAKYYLFRKYGYSLDFINSLLEFISYVDISQIYKSDKINLIKNIKLELINNNLYQYDYKFIELLKRFEVTFINVLELKENLNLINIVKKLTKVNIIKLSKSNSTLKYYEALNQEEEIINCLELVIKNKYDLNKVHFTNYNDDYLSIFKKVSYAYKIDFNIDTKMSIISHKDVKYFLNNLDLKFEELIENIKDNDIKNMIIDIINKYNIDNNDLLNSKDFLRDLLKNEKYESTKYKDAINVSNNLAISDDDIVFFLNFNVDVPSFKNNTYLDDDELSSLEMSTILEYNRIYKDYFIANLTNSNNINLCYPLNVKSGTNLESTLLDDLILEKEKVDLNLTSSFILNKHILAKHYDNFIIYNKDNKLLNEYDLSVLDYNNYDNSFKPFKEIPSYDYLSKLKLSYSTMKIYFDCPFRYYLDNVLKLKKYTKTINANLGTYAHYMLENSYEPDFEYDAVKKKYLEEVTLSPKEEVYTEFMDEVVKNVLTFNEKFESFSELDNVLREENIETIISGIKFTGFIDKILYKETADSFYFAIIDYKTGKDTPSLNNIDDGLNLQLPVYAYLINNTEKFKNKKIYIIGLYLQKVEIQKIKDIDKLDDFYKLQGFTTSDKSIASMLDPALRGEYIQSLKLTKDGEFYKNAKTIDDETISHILELIPTLVSKIKKSYLNMMFPINPYRLKDEKGCDYCEYKRVCYKTEKDYRDLKVESGDDENGMD